jgi:hypothetical protein
MVFGAACDCEVHNDSAKHAAKTNVLIKNPSYPVGACRAVIKGIVAIIDDFGNLDDIALIHRRHGTISEYDDVPASAVNAVEGALDHFSRVFHLG